MSIKLQNSFLLLRRSVLLIDSQTRPTRDGADDDHEKTKGHKEQFGLFPFGLYLPCLGLLVCSQLSRQDELRNIVQNTLGFKTSIRIGLGLDSGLWTHPHNSAASYPHQLANEFRIVLYRTVLGSFKLHPNRNTTIHRGDMKSVHDNRADGGVEVATTRKKSDGEIIMSSTL